MIVRVSDLTADSLINTGGNNLHHAALPHSKKTVQSAVLFDFQSPYNESSTSSTTTTITGTPLTIFTRHRSSVDDKNMEQTDESSRVEEALRESVILTYKGLSITAKISDIYKRVDEQNVCDNLRSQSSSVQRDLLEPNTTNCKSYLEGTVILPGKSLNVSLQIVNRFVDISPNKIQIDMDIDWLMDSGAIGDWSSMTSSDIKIDDIADKKVEFYFNRCGIMITLFISLVVKWSCSYPFTFSLHRSLCIAILLFFLCLHTGERLALL